MTQRKKAKDGVTLNDGSAAYVDLHNTSDAPVTISIGGGSYELAAGESRTFATGGHEVTANAELETGPHQDPIRIYAEPVQDAPVIDSITPEQDVAARDLRDAMIGDGSIQHGA